VLGTWCWWAPAWLTRLHHRVGISEGPPEDFTQQAISLAATTPENHAVRER